MERVYRVAEVIAWPAATWFAAEIALRRATGIAGTTDAALLFGCAAATVAACRLRLRFAPIDRG